MKALNWILVIITLGILALVSVSPFLNNRLPLTDDGNLHIYRSIVLDDAIRNDGRLYPRYASALAYGYGASLFNYFPPTSYYPTVIFHILGLGWVSAWKASVIFYVMLAGLGAYLWARQWLDNIGAFITATAYIYAPYTLFDTITRGSSNEFAGMALLPFALWGFTRLARFGRRSDFLLTVFSYALFILAHNVMTLYGTLLLMAYCGFLLLTSEAKFRVLWQMSSAGVLAIMMTAFFWLPALTETDFVKINGVLENLDFVDVTNTLRDLGAVFALPQTADPLQLQATVPISFSWILLVLAIIGFFLPQPPQTDSTQSNNVFGLHLFLFAGLGIVTLSQLTLSADFWQSIRLLQYSQFAWRPMSIGSLVLALLAGIGGSYLVRLIRPRTLKFTSLGIILAMIILYSVPWLYRPQIDLVANDVSDAQRYEVASRQATLSSYGEYLPAQTDATALNTAYFEAASSRLQANDSMTIVTSDEHGTEFSGELEVEDDTTLVFNWLAVPGWRATIDNERVDVQSIGSAGFVGIDVTSGQHDIRVWYSGTTTQRNATILSVFAILATIGLAIIYPKPNSIPHRSSHPSRQLLLIMSIVGLTLFGIKSLVIDRINSPFRAERYRDGLIRNVQMPFSVNFGNYIQLLGAELESTVASGDRTDITLYWSLVNDAIDSDYSTLVELVNSQGIVIAEASNFYPGGLATRNWLSNHYIEDVITLQIPDYTPPLDYRLRVSLIHSETGRRLDVLNAVGNPIGIETTLSTVTVTRPNAPAPSEDLPFQMLSTQGFNLIMFDDLPEQAQVGDELIVSWLWRTFDPQSDFTPQLLWGNSAGVSISPLIVDYAFSEWQVGDIWRGYHRVYVPPTLEAGDYEMAIAVGGQQINLNQQMRITVPERNFEIPDFEFEDGTRWQNGIQLLGYDTDERGITLYWQTQELLDENLRLFVQVFDDEGQMLAIDDSIPVDFQRPTTGWVTEEVITTRHEFENLDMRSYGLLIGWYDPLTDARIILDESEIDALALDLFP